MEAAIQASFREAATSVLSEIGFSGISIGNSDSAALEDVGIVAAVGLVGDLKGHFVVKIGHAPALAFVATLSGHLGMGNEDPNDQRYRKAALGEIANQIGGRATAILAGKGIECMITPPTVIAGDGVETALPESDEKASFPVSGEFGRFSCSVALKRVKSV